MIDEARRRGYTRAVTIGETLYPVDQPSAVDSRTSATEIWKRGVPLLFVAVFTMCASFAAAADGSLDWVKSASPDKHFRKDSQSGRYNFYVTYGYAEEIPSVGQTAFSKCYAGKVSLIRMKGTSDTAENAKQEVLQAKAREFAREYNRQMKWFLDEKGLSNCSPKEDWENATKELNDYVWGKDQQQGTLSIFVDKVPPRLTIAIVDRKRIDDVRTTTCKILVRNGIQESVRVDLSQWLRPPPDGFHSDPIGGFLCAKGIASTLIPGMDR